MRYCVLLAVLTFTSLLSAAPPTVESLRSEIDNKLAAIEGEVQRLRQSGGAEDAQSLAATLQSLRTQVAGKDAPAPSGGPEVHVVGVHEGAFPVGPRKFGQAAVDVQITDRPIILVLCAYNPIRWTLRVAKDAKIEKLIIGGYGEQELDFDLPGVAAEKHIYKAGDQQNYFHTYGEESDGHARAVKIIRQLTGSDIATMTGTYRYDGSPIVIGPANEHWRLQRALSAIRPVYAEATAFERAKNRVGINDIRFQAIYWKSIDMMRPEVVLADFTPAGPIEGTHQPLSGVNQIVADPRGTTWYGLSGHSLVRLDLKNQKGTKLEVQGDLPEMSWPDGVTWDSKRNRVVITTHGGVGYMYSYEPDANKWSLITDMRNTDLCSFTYSSEEDCYFGLVASMGRGDMYVRDYSPNGGAGRDTSLGRRVDENNRMMVLLTPPQLVAVGKYLVVLFPPPTSDRRQATGPMSCTVMEIKSRKIIYSGDIRPRAAAQANLAAPQFEQLWQSLRGNAAEAEQATTTLAGGGDGVVKLLRSKLLPLAPVDENRVNALISQLDAEAFAAREQATAQIRKLGAAAEPAVKKALAGTLTPDQRKRLEAILPDLKPLSRDPAPENIADPDLRREARALRVLALIGTPDAADFLRELTRGPAGSTRIMLARTALQTF